MPEKKYALAMYGGKPVRATPMPARGLVGEEEKEAVLEVFDNAIAAGGAIEYNGSKEKQYEREFTGFMGGGYADGVNSGTNAVFVSLGALELDVFSEVIVPPWTDPGAVMPVALLGCIPIMADSDPRTFNTSAEEIERVITGRTSAIIVAHIAGEPADMDPIMELARSKGLHVIEDCAQAHGAEYRGRKVGSIADVAAFSTMYGKHHCTGGQGGVVYTKNPDLYWKIKRFADRGKPYNLPNNTGTGLAELGSGVDHLGGYIRAGLNCNLDELSAAIGVAQLRKLPGLIETRYRIGEALKEGLKENRAVSVGWQVPETKQSYWFVRFRLDLKAVRADKQTFCTALRAEGIPVKTTFRKIPCEMPWFTDKKVFGNSKFPWSSPDYKGQRDPQFKFDNILKAVREHFTLDINENFGPREIEDILAAMNKVAKAFLG